VVLVALVALGAATGAYLLGATRSRVAAEAALRAARAEAQQQAQLQDGTPWHTDARHQFSSWRGAASSAAAQLLFSHPAVRALLQAQRSFTEQRVDLTHALEDSRSWVLRGVPRQDDLGAFCGFAGVARPVQASDEAQARAAALAPLLALQPGPALLALDTGSGWALHLCNEAAHSAWPELAVGQALPDALGAVPQALAMAFAAAGTPTAGAAAAVDGIDNSDIDGWQLQALDALPAGWRGLLLLKLPTQAGANAEADARARASADNESESASFSFTVSHDLRAPIRVVEGFTRIVKEDYGRLLDRVGNDHLDRVLGAAARMNLMIDALLTLARLSSQPLARQPVNLSQLAAYVVDDLRRTAPEREVEIEIEPGLATQGDPTLLRLVLENLLGNAWKYSGRTPRAHISLATIPHGNRIAYVVRDNGAGFDMRSSERLFSLFQRLHSASEFPGHGVGLASVRRIVRRHGGDIWAEAEPGRGAAFYFTLAG
jgi:signal transduction histidine kinase